MARIPGRSSSACVILSALLGSADGRSHARVQEGQLVKLKFAEFDPLSNPPALPDALAWKPGASEEPDYFLVQLRGIPSLESRSALLGAGAELLEYVPESAYLVRATPDELAEVGALEAVRALYPFPPAFRVDPEALADAEEGPRVYGIFLFPGEDVARASAAIVALGARLLESDAIEPERLRIEARPSLLEALAGVKAVGWIQGEHEPVLRNDKTAWVIQSNSSGNTSVWSHGPHGQNQIVGHIDGPIQMNSCYFFDPLVPAPGPTHRKVIMYNGSLGSDSHGTHTAGTAAGDQQPVTGSTFRNGMADLAKIAHTNLSLITSTNLNSKFVQLYGSGARLFTNSWGNDFTTAYDSWARDIDVFSWNQEDALVMFAVTNLSTLKNPENAKDVLAVGGSSQTPNQQNWCTGGQGPTSDGRRKPEIYAPGCGILSASTGSCGTTSMSGTSMACPAITGAAALVRQYFEDGFYPSGTAVPADAFTPTGATIKAVLINASVDMTGVAGYPSLKEGWGRLLLENSLFFSGDSEKLFVADVRKADGFSSAGQSHSYPVTVVSASEPLEITLSWHDAPAALFASFTPVNDLNLRVTGPGGTYLGNVFSGGQSATGGAFDTLNNVERVRFSSPVPGDYTVEVIAQGVPQPGQGYGLAVAGDIATTAGCGNFANYGIGTAGSGGIVPALAGSGTPTIGNAISLDVTLGLGGASGALVLGVTGQASIPVAGGILLVNQPLTIVNMTLGGAPGFPVVGVGSVPLFLPNNPALQGLVVDFQAGFLDPGAPSGGGVSFTNGVELCIG